MGQRIEDISAEFQNKISNQYSNLDINDGFIFLTDLSNFISKILEDLIGNSYVDLAKQLRDDELRIDDVHKYVAKIINVLATDNKTLPDLNIGELGLFELIDEIEKQRIAKIKKSPQEIIQDYIANLNDYTGK